MAHKKLRSHSIRGSLLGWIKNWLANRRKRIFMNGETTDLVQVTSGVPHYVVFIYYLCKLPQLKFIK